MLISPISWRCFNCDEVFTDRDAAQEHFGYRGNVEPPLCVADRKEYAIVRKELANMRKDFHETQADLERLSVRYDRVKEALIAARKHIGNGYQPPDLMEQIERALA
jgi:hypothetical protein